MLKEIVIQCGISCSDPQVFTINGVKAYLDDFGYMQDVSHESAPEYGCGDMKFIPYELTDRVLELYGITVSEYEQVCDQLEDAMHIGRCGWCA